MRVYYPPADTEIQNFSRAYPGSGITPNVLVLHTTETGSWPGYVGGAEAPHLTARADVGHHRLLWRQHFPLSMSSRALRNEQGGVETNTLNVIQIELVGTCAPATRDKYGYFFWPDAPDWALVELAKFVTWLHAESPTFPIKDAALRGWYAYGPDPRRPGVSPASYGASRARLTMKEWTNAYGILGHQHVPENVHGDPGKFDAARLVQFAKPDVKNPAPSTAAPAQSPPTLLQKTRANLRELRLRAIDRGRTRRARRFGQALRDIPKS